MAKLICGRRATSAHDQFMNAVVRSKQGFHVALETGNQHDGHELIVCSHTDDGPAPR
jgi:hypothetical protein